MKTTSKITVVLFVVAGLLVSLAGCGGVSGRIGLGKYGDITSGTYNLDLEPILESVLPPAKDYTPADPELYKLPNLEK